MLAATCRRLTTFWHASVPRRRQFTIAADRPHRIVGSATVFAELRLAFGTREASFVRFQQLAGSCGLAELELIHIRRGARLIRRRLDSIYSTGSIVLATAGASE